MSQRRFTNPLRERLKAKTQAVGVWVTLESATVTEVAAELGLDWVCIDMEHGSLDFRDVLNHLRAARGSETAVLVRVPTTSVDKIKRALDLGAHGILLPLIRNADELIEGFAHARYPLVGRRGLGHERALRWGMAIESYVAVADSETMVIPVIETKDASDNIDSILDVAGLEAIFFGPSDLSQSCGHRAVWEGPGIAEEILRIKRLAAKRNIASGVIGTSAEDIERRRREGFEMICVGSDIGLMIRQMRSLVEPMRAVPTRTGGY
jgi:2-keto-3-deoxy-L-rhamnonate aldolase RhmA